MGDDPDRDPRKVEAAVLAMLIERHPERLSAAQVLEGMTEVLLTPGRVAAVEDAIEALLGVGLLIRVGDSFHPTPAGLRAGELELGL